MFTELSGTNMMVMDHSGATKNWASMAMTGTQFNGFWTHDGATWVGSLFAVTTNNGAFDRYAHHYHSSGINHFNSYSASGGDEGQSGFVFRWDHSYCTEAYRFWCVYPGADGSYTTGCPLSSGKWSSLYIR